MAAGGQHIVFVEMSATGAGERALEHCVERGCEVTLLTRGPAPRVPSIDDVRVLRCETNDHGVVVDAARALNERSRVHGVTTTHDFYTPQAALVAETLDLPGLSYEAACGVRNKHRMRQTLQQICPHLNPPFALAGTERDALRFAATAGFPIVAKPPDANDSWNVVRIDDDEQLRGYMSAARGWGPNPSGQRRTPGVLLEGFVDGSEHTIDTVQHAGGDLELICVTGKEMLGENDRFFAEAGVFLPLKGEEIRLLFDEVRRALDALKITCGVIHTECRIQDGAVKVMEVNPRLAGDMMGSHMIDLAFGASAIEQVVDIALGNPTPWQPVWERGASLYGMTVPKTGIFRGVRNLDELRRLDGVEFVRVMLDEGARCHFPPRSNLDLVGRVIATGSTVEEAFERSKQAAKMADVIMEAAEPA